MYNNYKLTFRTKQELVYQEIRERIISTKFKPGERLLITHLAKELEVSESPVREALKRLISENFVIEKGVASFVAELSKEQFLEMLDIRLQLEVIAIRLSAKYIDEEGLKILLKDIDMMKESQQGIEWNIYSDLHKKFHNDCFSFCNVPYLYGAIRDAIDHHERGMHIFKLQLWRRKPHAALHEDLYEALKEHDEEKAAQALILHRKAAFEYYREQLEYGNK